MCFIAFVILCVLHCFECCVLFCVMCVNLRFYVIVVPLPPGTKPLTVNNNNNNNNILSQLTEPS